MITRSSAVDAHSLEMRMHVQALPAGYAMWQATHRCDEDKRTGLALQYTPDKGKKHLIRATSLFGKAQQGSGAEQLATCQGCDTTLRNIPF